jgi:hypothetical protein
VDIHQYLAGCAWDKADLEAFLDPETPGWARFDPLTGYALDDICMRDGVDDSFTISTYTPDSARRMVRYRERPCRINTYGDSFTQCHQVSDGETWQEVLAAHLGEPVRNFGVGGFGVYQAFCRLRHIEQGELGAPYVVLNIYDDDHVRNLDAARWFRLAGFRSAMGANIRSMMHANPWPHVRLDVSTGRFCARDNPMPAADDLYQLCDPATVDALFAGDEIVQLECLRNDIDVDDIEPLRALAEVLGADVDLAGPDRAHEADRLLVHYGLQSTLYTLELVRDFVAEHGRKLLIVLSYSGKSVIRHLRGEPRFDGVLLDYLSGTGLPVVDMLEEHAADARDFALDPAAYCDRYYIGHYNPTGNHFFAFAMKDPLVHWLDPTPVTYRGDGFVAAAGDLA